MHDQLHHTPYHKDEHERQQNPYQDEVACPTTLEITLARGVFLNPEKR